MIQGLCRKDAPVMWLGTCQIKLTTCLLIETLSALLDSRDFSYFLQNVSYMQFLEKYTHVKGMKVVQDVCMLQRKIHSLRTKTHFQIPSYILSFRPNLVLECSLYSLAFFFLFPSLMYTDQLKFNELPIERVPDASPHDNSHFCVNCSKVMKLMLLITCHFPACHFSFLYISI